MSAEKTNIWKRDEWADSNVTLSKVLKNKIKLIYNQIIFKCLKTRLSTKQVYTNGSILFDDSFNHFILIKLVSAKWFSLDGVKMIMIIKQSRLILQLDGHCDGNKTHFC